MRSKLFNVIYHPETAEIKPFWPLNIWTMDRQDAPRMASKWPGISGGIFARNDCGRRLEEILATGGRWAYTVSEANKSGLPRCGKHLSNPNPKAGISGDGARIILAYQALTRQRGKRFSF
jgi:hypothetical protein